MRRTMLMSLATVVLLLVGAGVAMADSFHLTWHGTGVSGYVDLQTTENTPGVYYVTSGSGHVVTTETGLLGTDIAVVEPIGYPPPNQYLSDDAFMGCDNVLTYPGTPTVLDGWGLLFAYAGGPVEGNLLQYGAGYEYAEQLDRDDDYNLFTTDVTIDQITESSAVPEPGFILLFGIGIGMVVLLAWRTKA